MENGKKCYMCKYFEIYYIKGENKYNKTKFGRCIKFQKNTGTCDTCENCDVKPYKRKVGRLAVVTLNGLLTELTEIRKIIEEECGEREEL